MSNYIVGSMPTREDTLQQSLLANIPALGVATLDENTFFWYLRNMYHATPSQVNDTVALLRWSIPSGLCYYTRTGTYNVFVTTDGSDPTSVNHQQAMRIIKDPTAPLPSGLHFQLEPVDGSDASVTAASPAAFLTVFSRGNRSQLQDPLGNRRTGAILFLPDFHNIWSQPTDLRFLKETIIALESGNSSGHRINNKVLISYPPGTDIPAEIAPLLYTDQFDSPDVNELESLIFFWLSEQAQERNNQQRESLFERHGFRVTDLTAQDTDSIQSFLDPSMRVQDEEGRLVWTPEAVATAITSLAQALTGLTWTEAQHTLIIAFQHSEYLGTAEVQEAKITFLNSHQALSVHNPARLPSYADVGGYQAIKDYISRHMSMFSPENRERARRIGVPNFKGCLLLGVPGTGKSLVARATARESGMLACELDIGKVMDKFVGGSEQNIARVIELVRKAAGNHGIVVIMDEVEKQLAGTNNAGASDAGTSSRVHRAFLTWLQDRLEPVIIFMTANQIDQLPPEFMRPGRVDTIWFFDLPGPSAREAILRVHLNRYPEVPQQVDIARVAREELCDFTGAEIEQLVKEAVLAYMHNESESINDELLISLKCQLKIQAHTHREQINALRRRAREFRLADTEECETPQSGGQAGILSLRRQQLQAEFDPESEVDLGLEESE